MISDTEGTFNLPKYINISSLNQTHYGDYKSFIEIGNEGLTFSNNFISYNYFEQTFIDLIFPTVMIVNQPTEIEVQGDNFWNTPYLQCYFGSIPAQ